MTGPIVTMQVEVTDDRSEYDELMKRLTVDASHVDIGIHSVTGEELVVIATANEFGATIQHPGGQPYLILNRPARKDRKNEVPLEDGKTLMFLKKGSKGMGTTKPHEIIIPARSFIRSTMDMNREQYNIQAKREWNAILDGPKTMQQALSALGLLIEGDIRNTVITLRNPPNAPSTIRAKGSDNPLVNIGTLAASIRFAVKSPQGRIIEISPGT